MKELLTADTAEYAHGLLKEAKELKITLESLGLSNVTLQEVAEILENINFKNALGGTIGIRIPDKDISDNDLIKRTKIESDWQNLLELNCLPTTELILVETKEGKGLYCLTAETEEEAVVFARKLFLTVADGISRMPRE